MNIRAIHAGLSTLVILQLVMLFALFFKLPPHPPEMIAIGAMGPVIAVSLCMAVAAAIFRGEGVVGILLILGACLLAALSYGPQKYIDPVFGQVWPAVIAAQIAIITLLYQIGVGLFRKAAR